jgi:agmatinase
MQKFLTDAFTEEQANVIVFGISIGKDGQKSIDSIRETSWFVEFFDADEKRNLLENIRVHDIGNVDLADATKKIREIRKSNRIPLVLSRAHLSSLYSLKGFDEVKLIVFDAHTDLHDRYLDKKIEDIDEGAIDEKINDATWLRRFCDEKGRENVLLIGMRSDAADVTDYLRDFNYFTSNFVKKNLELVKEKIKEFTQNSNVYVSLDIDVFDPSIAPAVDYPEPDGIYFDHFKQLIRSVSGKIIGADLVCLKPIENNQVTEFLAVKSIFEILGRT